MEEVANGFIPDVRPGSSVTQPVLGRNPQDPWHWSLDGPMHFPLYKLVVFPLPDVEIEDRKH